MKETPIKTNYRTSFAPDSEIKSLRGEGLDMGDVVDSTSPILFLTQSPTLS